MKTTGRRSFVLYIILALLLGGMLMLTYNIIVNGKDYVAMPYNGHIYAGDATVETGEILDRNNILLAHSKDGKRIYNDDETVRKSVLHTVGDSSGYIGTSIQATLRANLIGYNFVTGINQLPKNSYFGVSDINLTIDSDLCAMAYNLLDGKKGAIMISNYKTGEILCKVSAPSYDPMNVPSDLQENPNYSGVFLDNTISSRYTPGSIFKLVTLAAAIEYLPNWEDFTCTCNGEINVGNSKVTCMGHHGTIKAQQALGNSCNVFFSELALEIGTDKLQETAEKMGFNKIFSFQDFSSASSQIDLTNASDITLAWSGIGQGEVMCNPTQMLLLMGAIANGGNASSLEITSDGIFDGYNNEKIELLDKSTADILKEMMRTNVKNYYGEDRFSGLELCAKSGTAEVGEGIAPNAWFVGFSDNEETPYAFSIVVQEGGFGGQTAGNIASKLLGYLRDNY